MRLVLGENADSQIAGIDEVGEHEIDQPISATERNRGFGPVRGQRIQPLALTAGQDDAQHVWRFPHGFNLTAAANRCQGESPYWPPDWSSSDGLSVKVFGSARGANRHDGSSRLADGHATE